MLAGSAGHGAARTSRLHAAARGTGILRQCPSDSACPAVAQRHVPHSYLLGCMHVVACCGRYFGGPQGWLWRMGFVWISDDDTYFVRVGVAEML